MFSGGDSSGEGFNSINQLSNFGIGVSSACNAMTASGGDIDWASLAQQWIQMRDNSLAASMGDPAMPNAPPPPNISGNYGDFGKLEQKVVPAVKRATFEEKGEADMDMDDDEDNHEPSKAKSALHQTTTIASPLQVDSVSPPVLMQPHGNWYMQQQQPTASAGVGEPARQSQGQWNVWPPRVSLPPPGLTVPATANPTAHIPPLMKINVPNPNTMKTASVTTEDIAANNPPVMDAAKRKILPAWIREGLEKMEREKQKQLEKSQQHGSKDKLSDNEIVEASNLSKTNEYTVKTKFNDLDSDSSGKEGEAPYVKNNGRLAPLAAVVPKAPDSNSNDSCFDGEGDAEHSIVGKSYEQKLTELMIVVRRTLTELLLEVTNEEISSIAHEAAKSRKTKASSAQVIRKSALTSITGKLGLAAYGDSETDDSNASDNEASDNERNEDSEEELKAAIRAKRRAFAKVSEEIEENIADAATREEQKLKYYIQQEHVHHQSADEKKSHQQQQQQRESDKQHLGIHQDTAGGSGNSYERDFGETTESKLNQQLNGKRQIERSARKERTTRFSDNKDSKSSSMAAAASYISQINNSAKPKVAPANTSYPLPTVTPDPNGLYTSQAAYGGLSINNMLNAAEAALEKVVKNKSSASSTTSNERRRRQRRHRDSSVSSSSESDSSDSSSNNSRDSKRSSTSSKYKRKHKRSDTKKSKHSRKEDKYHSSGRRRYRRGSSRSDDDHDSHHRSHRSRQYSRRDSRSKSRSRSRSSYSSSRRRH